jgi:hypothetical protein
MNDVKDDDALAAIGQRLERTGDYIGQTGDGLLISAFDPPLSAGQHITEIVDSSFDPVENLQRRSRTCRRNIGGQAFISLSASSDRNTLLTMCPCWPAPQWREVYAWRPCAP